MQTTTVSQLKTSLRACLRQVKAGEEVIITEPGRPIARLLPIITLGLISMRSKLCIAYPPVPVF